jgi:hypothetical protein
VKHRVGKSKHSGGGTNNPRFQLDQVVNLPGLRCSKVGLLGDRSCHMIHLEFRPIGCSAEAEGTRIAGVLREGRNI